MVEYALILALIAIVVIVAVSVVGTNASEKMSSVAASLGGGIVGQATMRQALAAYCGTSRAGGGGISQYQNLEGSWVVVLDPLDAYANPEAIAAGYGKIENASCSQLDDAYPP